MFRCCGRVVCHCLPALVRSALQESGHCSSGVELAKQLDSQLSVNLGSKRERARGGAATALQGPEPHTTAPSLRHVALGLLKKLCEGVALSVGGGGAFPRTS